MRRSAPADGGTGDVRQHLHIAWGGLLCSDVRVPYTTRSSMKRILPLFLFALAPLSALVTDRHRIKAVPLFTQEGVFCTRVDPPFVLGAIHRCRSQMCATSSSKPTLGPVKLAMHHRGTAPRTWHKRRPRVDINANSSRPKHPKPQRAYGRHLRDARDRRARASINAGGLTAGDGGPH